MAKQLLSSSIEAPAFLGLNTQESTVSNDPSFATVADNAVIDKFGRVGSRKGWEYVTEGNPTINGGVQGIHKYFTPDNDEITIVWTNGTTSSDGQIFKSDNGGTTLTSLTPPNAFGTGDTLRAVDLNGELFLIGQGVETTKISGNNFASLAIADANDVTKYPKASAVLSAFGRVILANVNTLPSDVTGVSPKRTVFFSGLRDGEDFDAATSGFLDITGVMNDASGEITALAAFNGRLVIFCKDAIVIYEDRNNLDGSLDLNSLVLVEVIEGVGCIATDSVQNIGDDIVFLSQVGLLSLRRTIQEKSLPVTNISENIKDDLVNATSGTVEIKSVYNPFESFYLLLLPQVEIDGDTVTGKGRAFCFDTKNRLEDGTFRVTTWSGLSANNYYYDVVNSDMLIAENGGVAKYNTFSDNGAGYNFRYESNHFNLGQPTISKIVKKLKTVVIGANSQTIEFGVAYDFSGNFGKHTRKITLPTVKVSEYGVAEYSGHRIPSTNSDGLAADTTSPEYSSTISIDNPSLAIGGSGNVIQILVTTEITDEAMSLQRIDLLAKQGRLI